MPRLLIHMCTIVLTFDLSFTLFVCFCGFKLLFFLHMSLSLSVRIEAKHIELRERQSRDQRGAGGSSYPDVEDDDADPNYARIHTFRDRDVALMPQLPPQSPPYSAVHHSHARTPSPQRPPALPGHGSHGNNPGVTPDGDALDGLYAKVNKPRGAGAASPPVPAAAGDR